MIDFSEISWERFEDLSEKLLEAEGLKTRRLGRGPGQLGKDIIAWEYLGGPLSKMEERKWLVECKYSGNNESLGEEDIFNIYDRVTSQVANGYLLFTNCRLKVNLEKVIEGLKSKIGIDVWTSKKITVKTVLNNDIFRTFFPVSFNKWVRENRLIYLSQMGIFRGPLGHILSSLQFLVEAPNNSLNMEVNKEILNSLIPILRNIIDNMDEQLKIIRQKTV